MKKITNIIGYITAFAIMIAAVFKINHFPGAGVALVSTGVLLGIYFPVFIIDKMRETTQGRILSSHIAGALCTSFIALGVTFRLEHWEASGMLLTLGLAGFSFVFIPIHWVQKSKQPHAGNIMCAAGALGLMAFASGILFKLRHLPFAAILMATGAFLLMLVYFPQYMMNPAIHVETKRKYLRDSFFVIVIGALVTLYFIKSIEIHDMNSNMKEEAIQSLTNTDYK